MKRNSKRFPSDFMFQLSISEWQNLKCQIGTPSFDKADYQQTGNLRSQSVTSRHGGRRTPTYAFTEQGVAMLSSVLNSDHAIEGNIAIMRTFLQLSVWSSIRASSGWTSPSATSYSSRSNR